MVLDQDWRVIDGAGTAVSLLQPTGNLTIIDEPHQPISLNLGYTDARFTETVAGINQDGDPLQFVPEWTASLVVDYIRPNALFEMDLLLRADLSYVDHSLSQVNAIPRRRAAYEQIGLRLGLSNERYKAALFARNLTDKIANLGDNRSIAAETPGRPRWVVSRPRTIGLEVGVYF